MNASHARSPRNSRSRILAGSLPSTFNSPASGASCAPNKRSKVVLPLPDAPISATRSPVAISSPTPDTARTAPKRRDTSLS